MTVGQRYHVEEIVDKIITTLTGLVLPEPHGLAVSRVQFGGLEYLPTEQLPESILPAIFVKPLTLDSQQGPSLGHIRNTFPVRIVFVRRFSTTEEIPRQKVKDMLKIGNMLMDSFLFPGFSLTDNYQIIDMFVQRYEFEPPEDDIARVAASEISAGALVLEMTTRGRRS